MTATRPNIVLVILDALRADRLGIAGYRPALTPTLDRLAREGIYCTNHFSAGCPTQIAFPAMITSTRPFDYGGYTDGIHNRPHSFVEILRDGGYRTFGITTGHPCSSHFGYDRGFDRFIDLIDMFQWFRAAYITGLGDRITAWQKGRIGDDEIVELLETKYRTVLSDSLLYLDGLDSIGAAERGRKRRDWRAGIVAEQVLLDREPLAIARRMADLGNEYHFGLGSGTAPGLKRRLERRAAWDARLNRRIFLRSQRKAYPAHEVTRQVRRFLAERPRQPFFAMVHYFDLHESKLLIPNLSVRRLATLPMDAAKATTGRPPNAGGGLLYDIGLADQDRHVGRLLRMFERAGLRNETIFVFTADHGLETGRPFRGAGSDLSQFFFDNYIRVPLILHGPGIAAERIEALMSHLDLGPTILELAGLASPADFLGTPVTRRRHEPAPHLTFENAGKGRCDLESKTLYVGVRTADLKVVCAADGFAARERDAFDLASDPDEKANLQGSTTRLAEREACVRLAQARLDEVRASLAAGDRREKIAAPATIQDRRAG